MLLKREKLCCLDMQFGSEIQMDNEAHQLSLIVNKNVSHNRILQDKPVSLSKTHYIVLK